MEYIGNYFISGTDHIPIQEREDIKNQLYEIGYNIDNIKKISIFIDRSIKLNPVILIILLNKSNSKIPPGFHLIHKEYLEGFM